VVAPLILSLQSSKSSQEKPKSFDPHGTRVVTKIPTLTAGFEAKIVTGQIPCLSPKQQYQSTEPVGFT